MLSGWSMRYSRRGSMGRARVSEEVEPRDQDSEARDRFDRGAGKTIKGNTAMKNEPLEVTRGSGNVFRDFGQDTLRLMRQFNTKTRP